MIDGKRYDDWTEFKAAVEVAGFSFAPWNILDSSPGEAKVVDADGAQVGHWVFVPAAMGFEGGSEGWLAKDSLSYVARRSLPFDAPAFQVRYCGSGETLLETDDLLRAYRMALRNGADLIDAETGEVWVDAGSPVSGAWLQKRIEAAEAEELRAAAEGRDGR